MEISVIPIGTATPSIGDYIAEVVKVLEKDNLNYKLTDMGSIVEGDIDELFSIARKLHETSFKNETKRVITRIEIDDRRDKKVKIEDKVKSVMSRLKQKS